MARPTQDTGYALGYSHSSAVARRVQTCFVVALKRVVC